MHAPISWVADDANIQFIFPLNPLGKNDFLSFHYIAFLYFMRLEQGRIFFVLDSDESGEQALPGRVYADVPTLMRAGFMEPAVDDKPSQDEWGVFLSGYAPLLNGEGKYLLGIDMNAEEVDKKLSSLRLTGMISLIGSILLALLFALALSRGLG